MSKEETQTPTDPREECLKALNEVLTKYNMSLQPSLQLIPVAKADAETKVEDGVEDVSPEEDVTEEKDEEGGDS